MAQVGQRPYGQQSVVRKPLRAPILANENQKNAIQWILRNHDNDKIITADKPIPPNACQADSNIDFSSPLTLGDILGKTTPPNLQLLGVEKGYSQDGKTAIVTIPGNNTHPDGTKSVIQLTQQQVGFDDDLIEINCDGQFRYTIPAQPSQ